jgi:hypothetical protein
MKTVGRVRLPWGIRGDPSETSPQNLALRDFSLSTVWLCITHKCGEGQEQGEKWAKPGHFGAIRDEIATPNAAGQQVIELITGSIPSFLTL